MLASVDMITGLYLNFTFGTAMMTEFWAFAKSFRNVASYLFRSYISSWGFLSSVDDVTYFPYPALKYPFSRLRYIESQSGT